LIITYPSQGISLQPQAFLVSLRDSFEALTTEPLAQKITGDFRTITMKDLKLFQ